jgi:DNA-binding response OmpR family regulator
VSEKKLIIIIDDDHKLCTLLSDYLARFDYDVSYATNPNDGLALIVKTKPNLVILDVMLPQMDGFEVLRAIRKQSNIPVIMLTARGDVMDKIVGLELGADDYLPKPFEPRELAARIQTVLRRISDHPVKEQKIKAGDLVIDLQRGYASLAGTALDLTTTEFEILALLAQNPTKVLSRDDIMDQLKGIDWDAFNRSIDVTVSRLRQKLQDDPKRPTFIKTVWGRGYQFIGGNPVA